MSVWVRDVHEEGIEPHPGPPQCASVIASKNVNGIASGNKLYQTINSVIQHGDQLTAMLIQDHKLSKAKARAHKALAHKYKVAIAITYGTKDPQGNTHGGTAILIPYTAIEKTHKHETIHDAVARIEKSKRTLPDGRAVAISMLIKGKRRTIISAYAPTATQATVQRRKEFFMDLKHLASSRSIIGMDANAMADPSIDHPRGAASGQPQEVTRALNRLISEKGLVDPIRRSLGSEREYTSHHIVGGGQAWTRIDYILTPDDPSEIWYKFALPDTLPRKEHRVELDHIQQAIALEQADTERPGPLQYISEKIFDDPAFNATLLEKIQRIAQRNNGSAAATWEQIKMIARDLCVKQTRKVQYQESQALKLQRDRLRDMDNSLRDGTAAPGTIQARDQLEAQIKRDRRTEFTLFETLDQISYNMGKMHDRCTAAFFRPWKPSHKTSTIPAIKVANWTDPSAPEVERSKVRRRHPQKSDGSA